MSRWNLDFSHQLLLQSRWGIYTLKKCLFFFKGGGTPIDSQELLLDLRSEISPDSLQVPYGMLGIEHNSVHKTNTLSLYYLSAPSPPGGNAFQLDIGIYLRDFVYS